LVAFFAQQAFGAGAVAVAVPEAAAGAVFAAVAVCEAQQSGVLLALAVFAVQQEEAFLEVFAVVAFASSQALAATDVAMKAPKAKNKMVLRIVIKKLLNVPMI
jgi:hypothetical protein